MKRNIYFFILVVIGLACNSKQPEKEANQTSLVGTWKLLSGTLIEKGDTAVTDYTKNVSFIKIINKTHFSFMKHDLNKGKDSTASFDAGGGTYTLVGNTYTENLEYCNARDWEGNAFKFEISIHNDTLIQKGVEKIEKSGIDRLNIEKYLRVN
jgi:hypothetical protein